MESPQETFKTEDLLEYIESDRHLTMVLRAMTNTYNLTKENTNLIYRTIAVIGEAVDVEIALESIFCSDYPTLEDCILDSSEFDVDYVTQDFLDMDYMG